MIKLIVNLKLLMAFYVKDLPGFKNLEGLKEDKNAL